MAKWIVTVQTDEQLKTVAVFSAITWIGFKAELARVAGRITEDDIQEVKEVKITRQSG